MSESENESDADIRSKVRAYILEEFLPDSDPDELEDDMALTTGGILDSIATVKLVTFLEDEYDVEVEAHEMGDLDTVDDIVALVESKQSG